MLGMESNDTFAPSIRTRDGLGSPTRVARSGNTTVRSSRPVDIAPVFTTVQMSVVECPTTTGSSQSAKVTRRPASRGVRSRGVLERMSTHDSSATMTPPTAPLSTPRTHEREDGVTAPAGWARRLICRRNCPPGSSEGRSQETRDDASL